jgi:hypothetical protein
MGMQNSYSLLLVQRKIFIQYTMFTSDVATGYSRGSLLDCSPDAVYPEPVLHGLLRTLQKNAGESENPGYSRLFAYPPQLNILNHPPILYISIYNLCW